MCPYDNCKRSSGGGFTRQENLNEHLRRVHQKVEQGAGEQQQADQMANPVTPRKRRRLEEDQEGEGEGDGDGDDSSPTATDTSDESLRVQVKKLRREVSEMKAEMKAELRWQRETLERRRDGE